MLGENGIWNPKIVFSIIARVVMIVAIFAAIAYLVVINGIKDTETIVGTVGIIAAVGERFLPKIEE